jgi:hypothetical protein
MGEGVVRKSVFVFVLLEMQHTVSIFLRVLFWLYSPPTPFVYNVKCMAGGKGTKFHSHWDSWRVNSGVNALMLCNMRYFSTSLPQEGRSICIKLANYMPRHNDIILHRNYCYPKGTTQTDSVWEQDARKIVWPQERRWGCRNLQNDYLRNLSSSPNTVTMMKPNG